MHLVVGLGNPGPKYARNRHNVGFMVVERFARAEDWKSKFKGRYARLPIAGHDTVLLEPLTYMNLSGQSVLQAMQFFKVDLERVLVIHDELDLPFETVRLKMGGGAGGHNGVRSVIEQCGPDFPRLRIGVGRPGRGPGESFVLGDFDKAESALLEGVLDEATRAVDATVGGGLAAAMNTVNVRKKD